MLRISFVEYAFGAGPPGSGVWTQRPRQLPLNCKFNRSIDIGVCHLSTLEIYDILLSAKKDYQGDSYNILTRNCNHFSDDLCRRLTGNGIPSWINRLAWIGKTFIPQSLLKSILPPTAADQYQQENSQSFFTPPTAFNSASGAASFDSFGSGHTLSGNTPRTYTSSTAAANRSRSTAVVIIAIILIWLFLKFIGLFIPHRTHNPPSSNP